MRQEDTMILVGLFTVSYGYNMLYGHFASTLYMVIYSAVYAFVGYIIIAVLLAKIVEARKRMRGSDKQEGGDKK